MRFPKIRGTFLGVPYIREYSILESILGSPYFGKLPYTYIYIYTYIYMREQQRHRERERERESQRWYTVEAAFNMILSLHVGALCRSTIPRVTERLKQSTDINLLGAQPLCYVHGLP